MKSLTQRGILDLSSPFKQCRQQKLRPHCRAKPCLSLLSSSPFRTRDYQRSHFDEISGTSCVHNQLLGSSEIRRVSTMASTNLPEPHFQYLPIDDVERIENYRPRGYHPTIIGDFLQHRYRIVHKLGYGTFSITWLARDEKLEKYVAIKVGTADSNPKEPNILSSLNRPPLSRDLVLGRNFIPTVIDRFELESPNGKHPCYVTAPARTSIAGAKDGSYSRLFQAETAKSIVAQIALALVYIHAHGFVHGDLHLGNLLLRLPVGFDQLSVQELYGKYDPPEPERVVRLDGAPLPPGVPSHVVVPIWLGEPSDEVPADTTVLLADFGEAFSPSSEEKYISRAPMSVAPPEAVFEPENPLSFPADIWSLACVIWAILGQRPLFETFLPSRDKITAEQVDTLGKLPQDWWDRWQERSHWFTEDGKPNEGRLAQTWEDRFEYCIQEPRLKECIPAMGLEEKAALFTMLRAMLAFKAEERLTASQVLETDWMKNWALPELYKAQNAKHGAFTS